MKSQPKRVRYRIHYHQFYSIIDKHLLTLIKLNYAIYMDLLGNTAWNKGQRPKDKEKDHDGNDPPNTE